MPKSIDQGGDADRAHRRTVWPWTMRTERQRGLRDYRPWAIHLDAGADRPVLATVRTMNATRVQAWAALLSSVLLQSCGSEGAPTQRPTCAFHETTLGFHEESPLGFSAADILTPLLGKRECTWAWNDPGAAGDLYPSPSEVTAQISLAYTDGPVRFVAGTRVGQDPAVRLYCPSSVVVTAELSILTEDQALDVAIPVPMELTSIGATATHDVTSIDLGGDYAFSWIEDWYVSRRDLKVSASPKGWLTGELYEQAQKQPTQHGKSTHIEGVVFHAANWICAAPLT